MKKWCVVYSLLLAACLLCGCKHETPDRYAGVGYAEKIIGENYVTVVSATISESKKIIVTLNLSFEDIKLEDFKKIYISKNEVNAPEISLDIEESNALNAAEAFNSPYTGEVELVFIEDSIMSTDDVSRYSLYLEYDDGSNWTLPKFALG